MRRFKDLYVLDIGNCPFFSLIIAVDFSSSCFSGPWDCSSFVVSLHCSLPSVFFSPGCVINSFAYHRKLLSLAQPMWGRRNLKHEEGDVVAREAPAPCPTTTITATITIAITAIIITIAATVALMLILPCARRVVRTAGEVLRQICGVAPVRQEQRKSLHAKAARQEVIFWSHVSMNGCYEFLGLF